MIYYAGRWRTPAGVKRYREQNNASHRRRYAANLSERLRKKIETNDRLNRKDQDALTEAQSRLRARRG